MGARALQLIAAVAWVVAIVLIVNMVVMMARGLKIEDAPIVTDGLVVYSGHVP